MTATPPEEPQPLNILVYGAEKKGIFATKSLPGRNYTLHFEPFDTVRRFQEFDGLIVFQGIFEKIKFRTVQWSGEQIVEHSFDKNELDKRIKELRLLRTKGGFACFLLCEPFIDHRDDSGSGDLSQTDLVKYFLTPDGLYRHNFQNRVPHVTPVLSEFKRFLDLFGAADSWFEMAHQLASHVKPIATVQRQVVGMILARQFFCVPSQIPENGGSRITEFFDLLTDALVSVFRKQTFEIPAWADAYKFDEEKVALSRKTTLTEELSSLDAEIDSFRRFKRVLINDGDELVDDVKLVLEKGFGIAVEGIEEFRDDLKILGDDGNPVMFVEIKGTNRGVKREHVNQADSHRERADLAATFPSILIMNTSIKNARSLEEKDEAVASEQVKHAKHLNILILRTLDLLHLLGLFKRGQVSLGEVRRLFMTRAGWLKVTEDHWELVDK